MATIPHDPKCFESASLNCKPAKGLGNIQSRLLEVFEQHREEPLKREFLVQAVWDTTYMRNTRMLDLAVEKLRQKIRANGCAIETVWGWGYRLACQMVPNHSPEAPPRDVENGES